MYFTAPADNVWLDYMRNIITNDKLQYWNHMNVYETDYMRKIRGSLNKFPDVFRMGTFIDSTYMKLQSPSK